MKLINLKAILTVIFLSIIFIMTQISYVSAFSVRELLGLDKPEPKLVEETKPATEQTKDKGPDTEWAKTADNKVESNPQLDLDYFSLLLANMSQQERTKVLSDAGIFKQLIENEANNRSVVSAAISNKLHQDRHVEFLMRRGAENILRESYLNRLIANKLPADFPSSEQIEEYYTNNKQQFVVPERVHVWQIFFNNPKDADAKQLASIKKKASGVLSKLKKGKADFSSIALSESEHEQSKALGGYMGVLKTSELLPELKQSVLELKEGKLSDLVESESGIHILKRGKILPAETVELSQVEPQIRQLLIKQANAQLRNAIHVQARKEFPQAISDEEIEEWRLRLRTDTN